LKLKFILMNPNFSVPSLRKPDIQGGSNLNSTKDLSSIGPGNKSQLRKKSKNFELDSFVMSMLSSTADNKLVNIIQDHK
jgi:hypothetical protein